MIDHQNNALAEIGQKLWAVEITAGVIGDTGLHFTEEEGGSDEVHQAWADAILENYQLLRGALEDIKRAVLLLPPEMAGGIATAFRHEDQVSKARGAATCMLADIQRQIAENKGGAA
ncbi:hypothetical protein [Paracoccus beibuensis]|uniref:hypothetical protein n=1 Tax=Paracoccus beibuensis TaxID=547602 RepID=UPI00223F6E7A|nr:hypothetical protein [Paracoccus beibuensis]